MSFNINIERICGICGTNKKFDVLCVFPSDIEEKLFVSYICSACAKDGVEFTMKGFPIDGNIKKHPNIKD